MAERMPQTTGWLLVSHCTGSLQTIGNLLSEVETRYCSVVASKFADPEMIIGGVMIPANIARANWESAGCFLKTPGKESQRRRGCRGLWPAKHRHKH